MRGIRFYHNFFRPLPVVFLLVCLGSLEEVLAQARSTFPMPNVIGLTVEEAKSKVLSAGRRSGASSARAVVSSRQTSSRPAGQIIRQSDAVGKPMQPYRDDVGGKYGEVVFTVVVSKGPPVPTSFPMPNVVGITVPEAERRVLSAGQQVRVTSTRAVIVDRRADNRPAGQIIGQMDAIGKPMRPNVDDVSGRYGEVTFGVVVSTGLELAPDFVGRDLNMARLYASRQKVDLNIGSVERNPRIPQGTVARQSPAPGEPMQRRRVTVYPSSGYPLPNYVQRSIEDARNDSRRLGFSLQQQNENRLGIPNGIIFDQDPDEDTLLPLKEPVRVKVSLGWPVPDFIEKHASEADGIARENRIRLRKTMQDNFEVPAGIIFSQQPLARNPLPPDQIVNVTISRGYPLPNLVGMHENEVRQLAAELRFGIDIRRQPIVDRISGFVDQQSPEPSARLPLDRPVNVVISEGWETPSFLTLEEDEANSLAGERQISLVVDGRRQDRTAQPGIVINQSPLPGTLLNPGQAVDIVVSTGYPTPRFIGLAEAEAMSLAGNERIILEIDKKASPSFPAGIVSGQSVEPGVPLPADNRVSVTISSGWPTPDFVGKSEEEANAIATDSNITLVKIASREHFEQLAGIVIEQQPKKDEVIPADRTVRISLSLGWPRAPAAVGKPTDSVRPAFLDRHPNVIVDLSQTILTLKPAGTVISQHPEAGVKLDLEQRLKLVESDQKPPWLWPVIGLLALAGVISAIKWLSPDVSSSSPRTNDLGGIRLLATRDHGIQTTSHKDGDKTERTETNEIVEIRVSADLGEQSAVPVNDKGDKK